MLKKLRALLTGGIIGATAGAIVGSAIWAVSWLDRAQSLDSLLGTLASLVPLGATAGITFGLGLAAIGRSAPSDPPAFC